MNNKMAKWASFGCLLTFICACNAREESAAVMVDKDQIKKEIQAKEDSFAYLYNRGEFRDIGYYADDAKSYFQGRPPLESKDSIIAFLKADLATNPDQISFNTREVFVSNDGNQV